MTLTDGRVTERVNLTNVEELDIHLDWVLCKLRPIFHEHNTFSSGHLHEFRRHLPAKDH